MQTNRDSAQEEIKIRAKLEMQWQCVGEGMADKHVLLMRALTGKNLLVPNWKCVSEIYKKSCPLT